MPFQAQPLRADTARKIRVDAVDRERAAQIEPQHPNADEPTFNNPAHDDYRMGSYSKGLKHNAFGEVDPASYDSLLHACMTGQPADFQAVTLGCVGNGAVKLVNPQADLAFDLEGADAQRLAIPASPEVRSAERAAEMIEMYWMALCRDIPFSAYGQEPLTLAAIAELDGLGTTFKGPREGGHVNAQTLFRGNTPSETTGPYMSQFFLQAAPFGALSVNDAHGNPAQQYNTYQPGIDYMTQPAVWLAVQNGQAAIVPPPPNQPFGANVMLGPRYLKDGWGGSAFVHVDELHQGYFMAALNLLENLKMASYDVDNPYQPPNACSKTEAGFVTFGNPPFATLVAEVATRALKAQWYQKWFVHRTLRPEAYGGLVYYQITAGRAYQLHPSVINSVAAKTVFATYGTYFLPEAFPEGSPQHPSYGSGRATVAGACATIIKAFFNETLPITNIVIPNYDGTRLVAYTGPGATTLTVATEANKIAGNVGIFRMHAGVHWRSDHVASILLGERIAISILQDQKDIYNEPFTGWKFTDFQGNPVHIV